MSVVKTEEEGKEVKFEEKRRGSGRNLLSISPQSSSRQLFSPPVSSRDRISESLQAMASVATGYISVGGNRNPGAADWDVQSGVLAFGADNNVALWEPLVSPLKSINLLRVIRNVLTSDPRTIPTAGCTLYSLAIRIKSAWSDFTHAPLQGRESSSPAQSITQSEFGSRIMPTYGTTSWHTPSKVIRDQSMR